MTIRRFHRLTVAFIVMMSFLLPLQAAWGAAAAYCEHEVTSEASKHFGHHQHVHKADSHDASAKKSSAKKAVVDGDCASCHMGGLAVTANVSDRPPASNLSSNLVPGALRAHESAFTRAPDRPQWARLV